MEIDVRKLGFVTREILKELVARHDIVQSLLRQFERTDSLGDEVRLSLLHELTWRELSGERGVRALPHDWRRKVTMAADSIGWRVDVKRDNVKWLRKLRVRVRV